ncbi:MAG: LysM peptidoglycan-binding domain-containing protein [Peptoniphilaceae bacterium]|nr:LysM peptidoglycan-binding domain-containing protein [Peptoniphilaceae bacterium]MDY6086038.1 LysM peptidoglycan-binding domain-containing protein [Peptoniphilaceae bacterium]
MKRTIIVNQRRFSLFVISCSLLLSIGLTLLFGFLSNRTALGAEVSPTRVVVVKANDTVWEIAQPIAASQQRDVRDVVRDIYELNSLAHATIHPGQSLRVPSY